MGCEEREKKYNKLNDKIENEEVFLFVRFIYLFISHSHIGVAH